MLVVGKPIGGGVPVAAYGMTAEVAARIEPAMRGHEIDVAGVGGTLTGSALAMAAARATLANALREEDFAVAVPLATRFAEGVARGDRGVRAPLARAAARLPGGVLVLPSSARRRRRGCRGRRGARGLHAPVGTEPRGTAHPVPQHGAVLPAPHRGRCRPAHPGLPRGRPGPPRRDAELAHPDDAERPSRRIRMSGCANSGWFCRQDPPTRRGVRRWRRGWRPSRRSLRARRRRRRSRGSAAGCRPRWSASRRRSRAPSAWPGRAPPPGG